MRRIRLGQVEDNELVNLEGTIGIENGDLYLEVEDGVIDGRNSAIENLASVSTEVVSIGNIVCELRWSGSGDSQEIPDETMTKVEWDTIDIEDSDVIEADLDNDEVIVKGEGRYLTSAQVGWEGGSFSTGDLIRCSIFQNGSRQSLYDGRKSGDGFESSFAPPTVLDLSESDTISVRVEQRSGDTQRLNSDSSAAPDFGIFTVVRVG